MSEAMRKDATWRGEVYRRRNGTYRMTPRQRRRMAHKHNHAMAPFVRPFPRQRGAA